MKFPHPVNFRIDTDNVYASADGASLHFSYKFDSSTGRLSDLGRCTVDEYIVNLDNAHTVNGTYYAPSPPWPANASFPNPYDGDDFGAQLGGIDDDTGFTHANFVKPYTVAEINDNQWFRYRCPYINQGQPVNLTGQINILSAIYSKDCCGHGPWYYTVQKSGYESKIDPLP